MAKILYSPESRDDLIAIKGYIKNDLPNPEAADRIVGNITRKIRTLEKTPQIGAQLSANIEVSTEYRFIVSGNYLVFYHIRDNICYIIRVLYRKRDYISILFGEETE